MDRTLSMSTTHTDTGPTLLDARAVNVGFRDFLNCMDPPRHPACRLGRASVFAALGFLERPNAVNRFACSRREVLFAT